MNPAGDNKITGIGKTSQKELTLEWYVKTPQTNAFQITGHLLNSQHCIPNINSAIVEDIKLVVCRKETYLLSRLLAMYLTWCF